MLRQVAAALLLVPCIGHGAETVNIYNWVDYIGPTTLADFQRDSGVTPVYRLFDSNETLDEKLRARHSGYDVVFPSAHFLPRQIQRHDLQPLDKSQLPNWKNLNPVMLRLLETSDPGNRYGFPYLWGSAGLGYNRAQVKAALGADAPVDSWDLIFKPQYLDKLAQCGVAIIDSAPDLIPSALNYLGLPPQSTNPADYDKALALWLQARPFIRYLDSSHYADDLASGKICVAVGFSGDLLQAEGKAMDAHKGVELGYSVPREGAPVYFDMVAMPVDAPNPKAAYAFMNYLLEPKVMADITNHVHYANGNEAADEHVAPDIRSDPQIYPDSQLMSKLFTLQPLPREIDELRNRIWQQVRDGS